MEKYKIAAAPMAGITDRPFRKLLKYVSGDCVDLMFTEMISAKGIVMENEGTRMMLPNKDEEVVVQLFGKEPDDFRVAAEYIAENYPKISGIDINAACPVKKVIRNGAGAAMVKDLDNLKNVMAVLVEIAHKFGKKASIKIRKGWNSDVNYEKVLEIAESLEFDQLYIHGRTAEQKYAGTADDEVLLNMKNAKVDIYWSGDIFTHENAMGIIGKYPFIRGVLVARGMLGNPWIFRNIKNGLAGMPVYEVTASEKIDVIKIHMDYMLEEHSDYKVAGQFKKFITGYTHGISNAREKRHRILLLKNTEEMLQALIETINSN